MKREKMWEKMQNQALKNCGVISWSIMDIIILSKREEK
jgi:hypothetical protein